MVGCMWSHELIMGISAATEAKEENVSICCSRRSISPPLPPVSVSGFHCGAVEGRTNGKVG